MLGRARTCYGLLKDQFHLSRGERLFNFEMGLVKKNHNYGFSPHLLRQYLSNKYLSQNLNNKIEFKPDKILGENFLTAECSSTYFPNFKITMKTRNEPERLVVILPGSFTGGVAAVSDSFSDSILELNCGVISWDWPLQGKRWDQRYAQNLSMISNVEREYARFLPTLGTNLFDEYIQEFANIMDKLERLFPNSKIDVVGWSQGAHFAWYAPIFAGNVKRVFICGSLALYQHLIVEGKTHIHGFSHYPNFSETNWELTDLLEIHKTQNVTTYFIYGNQDRGILDTSVDEILNTGSIPSRNIISIKGVGHEFAGPIEDQCLQLLKIG